METISISENIADRNAATTDVKENDIGDKCEESSDAEDDVDVEIQRAPKQRKQLLHEQSR